DSWRGDRARELVRKDCDRQQSGTTEAYGRYPVLRQTHTLPCCLWRGERTFHARGSKRVPGGHCPLQALQVHEQFCGELVADFAILLKELVDEVFQPRWQLRIQMYR